MRKNFRIKMSFIKIMIALLLLWSFAEPIEISAKSSPAGSWNRGTIQQIATGAYHSLALKSDGTVAAWGSNTLGQATVPVGLTDVVTIAARGSHSLALKSDGTVVAWGNNFKGQATVPVGLTDVVAIAAGNFHSLALKSDGTVVAWGDNEKGQTTVPDGLKGVVAIAAGGFHSLALKSDGTVVAWGYNDMGQTTVPDGLTDVVAIAAGIYHSLALKSDGTVVAWGYNGMGQTTVPGELEGVVAIAAGAYHSLALKSDGTVVAWGSGVPDGLEGVVAIAAGGNHSLALKSDGTFVAWGSDYYGEATVPAGLTAPVKGKSIAAGVYYSLALKSDGTVVAWGDNGAGQTTVPVGLEGVVAIAAGSFHSLALKSDGTVIAWGNNDLGQATVPVGLEGVVAIAAGGYHSLALKSDGTVIAWGHNGFGQATVPVGLTDVVAIAAGDYHSLALKSDGTVVAWGSNFNGEAIVPGGLEGVVAIAAGGNHSLALKSDGTVVAWGDNGFGQATVPAGLKGIVAIAAGGLHSLALKSDGTVVAWGYNDVGQTTVPVGLKGVAAIAAGGYHSLALKPDGTVIAWGHNGFGQANVPGSADLSGLSLQEGAIDPLFEPSVTEYTYSYTGPWVSDLHVTAALADSSYSALYVNNGLQTSGNVTSVPVTALSTVIPVRVEPYLKQGKTYTIRSVYVNDGETPVIFLKGASPMTVEVNSPFTDPGAMALDLQDDGLSSKILVTGTVDPTKLGTYILSYDVSDTSGNAAQTVTRTVYVKDTQPPVLELLGESEMRVSVGAAFTDPKATATDAYYGDVSSLIVVTGTVDTSKAGDYTLRYNVQDPSGNAAAEVTRTVKVVSQGTSTGDSDSSSTVTDSVIDLNGVSLNPDTIDTTKPSATLEVTPKDGVAYVSIPASILTSLGDQNATFFIEIQTPYGRYQVPVNLASLIPGLTDLLAANNLKAEDVSFKITLTDKSGDADIQAAFANGLPNGKVMGAMVDFKIEIFNNKTKQTIGKADRFSKAMVRIIPMPREMTDLPELWGAFRYNETTKQFEFIPARKVQIDGIWYVMINSYTNSVYVVADNPVSFADIEKHWGKPYVDLAAAKGLVAGVGVGRYDPAKAVTRAEFTAMLVRALGRSTFTGSTAPYNDVKSGAWYFSEVAAAKELGLLDFVSGNRFNPNQPLTREEMASMLAAAVHLEQFPITEEAVNLNRYKDIGSVDAAYLQDVRLMVKLHIMEGRSADTFSPKNTTTRAEAAVVFIKTLQAVGMID